MNALCGGQHGVSQTGIIGTIPATRLVLGARDHDFDVCSGGQNAYVLDRKLGFTTLTPVHF